VRHRQRHTNSISIVDCKRYHIPVLLKETIDGLDIKSDGVYADLTFGGGGHSREMLARLGDKGQIFCFDQDLDAAEGALDDKRCQFVRSNFKYLKNWMRYYGVEHLDGILADLGVSSHHLDTGERGFSFRHDAPLDMRMNQKAKLSAKTIVEEYPEDKLADVFYLYGELRNSRQLAAAIVKARNKRSISTTGQLAELLRPMTGHDREKKDLARVFQALRIEVNGEMDALRRMLAATTEMLGKGGRLAILTYHSLEDRMVKNLIKTGNVEGILKTDIYGRADIPFRAVNRGVTVPSAEEQLLNPRSRSAKLRIAEKVGL